MAAPATPANLAVDSVASNCVKLTYDDVADETGFRMYKSFDGGTTYERIAEIDADTLTYYDFDVDESTQYYYKVSAYNDDGESALSSSVNGTTEAKSEKEAWHGGRKVKYDENALYFHEEDDVDVVGHRSETTMRSDSAPSQDKDVLRLTDASRTIEDVNPNLTIHATVEEDIDEGRESVIRFKGEQSGGEISTLAIIRAHHNGSFDDEKGEISFRVNEGSDSDTPVDHMRLNEDGLHLIGGGSPDLIVEETAAGASAQVELRNTVRRWWIQADGSPDAFSIQDKGSGSDSNAALVIQGADLFLGLGGEGSPETLIEMSHATPYITLHNTSHEDTDGGRESRLNFKGEQSGGEESTLARIQAQHDGAADDEKGDLVFYTNDGSDSDTPTERLRIDSVGQVTIANDLDHDGTNVGFYGKAPTSQAAHFADASTSHTVTDPADSPADADALRDDLVANAIPDIEAALDALGTKINSIIAVLENVGLMASS